MIFDHRTYPLRPGAMGSYLALYEEHGLGPWIRHLGQQTSILVPAPFFRLPDR